MKTIAFIPVRGGSKSIPLKNIKPFCGKPLVCWNIEALENCKDVDEVIVATGILLKSKITERLGCIVGQQKMLVIHHLLKA